jgi:3D (Asp-Asp-Asp) domain-containing protein
VRKVAVAAATLALACFLPKAQTSGSTVGTLAPSFMYKGWGVSAPAQPGKYLGRFKVTYYWAVDESEYSSSQSQALYLADGSLLGRFSSAFIKAFKVEAAAKLRDGRCISYLKQRGRAEVVDKFLGYGGHKLEELKSIAVDPRIIPLGSIVYIPQAENVVVDGKVQSGVFYAHDIGSAVKGKHIDVFVGARGNMRAAPSTPGSTSFATRSGTARPVS